MSQSGFAAMLAAIDFDDQLCAVPCEICYVSADWHLFAEMGVRETLPQPSPNLAFLRRHFPAQAARAGDDVWGESEAFHG
jgi:hypothetical protein